MKIGIMTFWWSQDNYGQLLQCYALQKYLRDAGHDAYLIRYNSQSDYVPLPFYERLKKACNITDVVKFLCRKIKEKKSRLEIIDNPRFFDNFRDENIVSSENVYNHFSELTIEPPDADLYIVGSDQVWSSIMSPIKSYENVTNAFFLNFGSKEVRRISYAASWGADKITDEYIKFISPLLERFSSVSVREEKGIELCRKCKRDDAICVPDPTFLLTAEDYASAFINEKKYIEEKYVVLYLLNNPFMFNLDLIYEWAKEKNLKVKYITGNGLVDKYDKIYPSIPEWLELINNAEYIITNSFHCSVFSLLFKKKFAVIPLVGAYKGLNSRMDSLFKLCGIKGRYLYEDSFNIIEEEYDCNTESIRTNAITFLKGALK